MLLMLFFCCFFYLEGLFIDVKKVKGETSVKSVNGLVYRQRIPNKLCPPLPKSGIVKCKQQQIQYTVT